MKLIQQSKLFFKEGNSDKVYEIDLCELSPNEYLVNFRYGRRGSTLKEGTKTPEAVTREKAELTFSALENEKRHKGYATETETFIELPSLNAVDPQTIKGAILQRLQDAANGTNSFKTEWKTSRVIWKAAVSQIEEAIPFIIKLATKGDEMQAYSALWALVQFKAAQAEPLFSSFAFNTKQKIHLKNIACEGLLTILQGDALTQFSKQLIEQLPNEIRYAIETNNADTLAVCLTQPGNADYFSQLYLLCKTQPQILPVLAEALKTWAFRPPYFKQIRSIYKLAQLKNDASTLAVLSYRFEKERPMFKRTISLDSNYKKYVDVIGQSVRVGAELKSKESKLAFSQFTKEYFQKNAVEYLKSTGKEADAKTYLKLAVATLLQYTEADYTKAEECPFNSYGQYDYKTKLYSFTLINYPECSESLLLSTILFNNDVERKQQANLKYILGKRVVTSSRYYYSPNDVQEVVTNKPATTDNKTTGQTPDKSIVGSVVNVFKNIFSKKQTDNYQRDERASIGSAIVTREEPVSSIPRLELYPEHWDAMPEAYVQLLMQAKMNIIHRFAYNNLKARTDFDAICKRFDGKALLQLLNSGFELPNELGFEMLEKRKEEFYRDTVFIGSVLNCNSAKARQWAQALVESDAAYYFNELPLAMSIIFNSKEENNNWITDLLQKTKFSEERSQALLGKAIMELLHLQNTDNNNTLATMVIGRLKIIAQPQMERISWNIVEQLIASPLQANKILAGNIMMSKTQHASPTEIPVSLTQLFMENNVQEVRQTGIQLLNQYPDNFLLENIQFVLSLADNIYKEVVEAALNCVRRLIAYNVSTGNDAIRHFTYTLIRKGKFAGSHALINSFVTNELKPYHNSGLRPKDITKLVHAQYRQSQLTGYEILTNYNKPHDFTLGQIISFGSHELLAMRQWCWNYYKQNVARIRYEREKALSIVDAKWDDTRTYAFHFFKTEFIETDWDTDTLITIVDSIRPDVESFGKELITRHFKAEHAMEYLNKLSEHPSVNVQAFVTNYLTLYAADKPELLQQLDFYFRSVLTRVNKARVAKDRIFAFLHQEALKSPSAAACIVPIIDDVSAQSTVQDKATCIHILTEVKNKYPELDMHLMIK